MTTTQNITGINQTPYAPSVIIVGDRIIGTDVTMGSQREGWVTTIVGPIRTPDCGGYRYHILTDQFYASGKQLTAVVYAEKLVGPLVEKIDDYDEPGVLEELDAEWAQLIADGE